MKRTLIFAAVLFVLAACNLFGQALSGTIVGTVTDQVGAVVPGVTVTLVNEGEDCVAFREQTGGQIRRPLSNHA